MSLKCRQAFLRLQSVAFRMQNPHVLVSIATRHHFEGLQNMTCFAPDCRIAFGTEGKFRFVHAVSDSSFFRLRRQQNNMMAFVPRTQQRAAQLHAAVSRSSTEQQQQHGAAFQAPAGAECSSKTQHQQSAAQHVAPASSSTEQAPQRQSGQEATTQAIRKPGRPFSGQQQSPARSSSTSSCMVVCLSGLWSVYVRVCALFVSLSLCDCPRSGVGECVFATILDISTGPKTLHRHVTYELSHYWLMWVAALAPSRCCRLWSSMPRLVVGPRRRPRRTGNGELVCLRLGAAWPVLP